MEDFVLIHLGSGALGLGFIVPIFNNSKYVKKSFICNRTKSGSSIERNEILKEERRYYVLSGNSKDCINFTGFISLDEEFDVLLDLIKNEKNIILTTALKEYGIKEQIARIAELIYTYTLKKGANPLTILPCENALDADTLKSYVLKYYENNHINYDSVSFHNNVLFLPCVVDRICNKPIVSANKDVVVKAERFGSLIVLDPYSSVRNLLENEYITVVPEIEPYVRRKKWTVNALHQVLSIYAWYYSYPFLNVFLRSELGSEILNGVTEEIYKVYVFNETDLNMIGEARSIFDSLKIRMLHSPSHVNTALTRLSRPDNLPSFYADFYRKLGHPTLNYLECTKRPLYWIPLVILKLSKIITENKYIR